MANAEFFQKLGLFVAPGFLDAGTCRRVNEAMKAPSWTEGTIGSHDQFAVNREYRRAKLVDVAPALFDEIQQRLRAVMPAVAAHYGVTLADCQVPQFLAYGPGDFYKPHRDRIHREGAAQFSAQRQVTAIIFVNARAAAGTPDTYGGGELTLYEMFDDEEGKKLGLPIDPEPGLLITFPSTRLHAVAPVEHGERRTIASWFI